MFLKAVATSALSASKATCRLLSWTMPGAKLHKVESFYEAVDRLTHWLPNRSLLTYFSLVNGVCIFQVSIIYLYHYINIKTYYVCVSVYVCILKCADIIQDSVDMQAGRVSWKEFVETWKTNAADYSSSRLMRQCRKLHSQNFIC